MANKDTKVVVANQIKNLGNENLEANEEIRKLRQQMIEMHQTWVNGLPPPPFPIDNLEYLSSLPSLSHARFPIFVDMPQHALESTQGNTIQTLPIFISSLLNTKLPHTQLHLLFMLLWCHPHLKILLLISIK